MVQNFHELWSKSITDNKSNHLLHPRLRFFLRLCQHCHPWNVGFCRCFLAQILAEQKNYPKNFPRTLKKRQGGFLTIRNGSVNGVLLGGLVVEMSWKKKNMRKSGILSAFAASICPKNLSLWIEMESANSILIALLLQKNTII